MEAVAYLGGFVLLVIAVLALCLRFTPKAKPQTMDDPYWLDGDGEPRIF